VPAVRRPQGGRRSPGVDGGDRRAALRDLLDLAPREQHPYSVVSIARQRFQTELRELDVDGMVEGLDLAADARALGPHGSPPPASKRAEAPVCPQPSGPSSAEGPERSAFPALRFLRWTSGMSATTEGGSGSSRSMTRKRCAPSKGSATSVGTSSRSCTAICTPAPR